MLLRDNDASVKSLSVVRGGAKNGLQIYRAKRMPEQAVISTNPHFGIVYRTPFRILRPVDGDKCGTEARGVQFPS